MRYPGADNIAVLRLERASRARIISEGREWKRGLHGPAANPSKPPPAGLCSSIDPAPGRAPAKVMIRGRLLTATKSDRAYC
jgi:hypothetical protein